MVVEDFPQLLGEGMKSVEGERTLEEEEEAMEVMEGEEVQADAQSQVLRGQLLRRTSWSILSAFYSLTLLLSSIFHSFWGSNGI
jgi:CHASE2 domain-containing sensor protein